jgi:hypothetical protein
MPIHILTHNACYTDNSRYSVLCNIMYHPVPGAMPLDLTISSPQNTSYLIQISHHI